MYLCSAQLVINKYHPYLLCSELGLCSCIAAQDSVLDMCSVRMFTRTRQSSKPDSLMQVARQLPPGVLDDRELLAEVEAEFSRMDVNGDGVISLEEFKEALKLMNTP